MRQFAYLGVLLGCLVCALWLEPVLRVNVLRRWRRLLLTLAPVVVVFTLWDVAAIAAGHWTFDPEQTTGVLLPGDLPLDELLFFVVVPFCAILGFEAVRAVNRWPAGDEPPAGQVGPDATGPAGPAAAAGPARPDAAGPVDASARERAV
ncbi:lycopene cyclase domain-containing protein [Micromonospora sp. WMMD882]|uniref:lycopene cyclase domain-containing protein n=1 Tax=Micromonospora sp. WMMD882 TaxID=3015151 RepID=UPI00248CBA61|nr:lycopene cyclase domain-containing protein [Micromonospora sp. WMMD882]WBB79993.1 lycopene cyclase domain-containing protein [Micromonospora sp. WMMD882]